MTSTFNLQKIRFSEFSHFAYFLSGNILLLGIKILPDFSSTTAKLSIISGPTPPFIIQISYTTAIIMSPLKFRLCKFWNQNSHEFSLQVRCQTLWSGTGNRREHANLRFIDKKGRIRFLFAKIIKYRIWQWIPKAIKGSLVLSAACWVPQRESL